MVLSTKRNAQDSELDPTKSIKEQFNLLRMIDNENYHHILQT